MLGLDYLGLGSKYWPVLDSLGLFPQGWALGCFDTEFGDVIPNLTTFLESGKVALVRTHIYWDPNHAIKRNSLCPLDLLKARCPIYEGLALRYPATKFLISHSCEYAAPNEKEVQARVDIIHKFAPHCMAVNARMKGPITADAREEMHGKDVAGFKGDIVSLDGDSAFAINAHDWVTRNRRADVTFMWIHSFNLRKSSYPAGQQPPPPKLRRTKPTKDEIKRVIALTK